MIVPMKRLLLLCVAKEADATLMALRNLGAVHLDLSAENGEESAVAGSALEKAEKAVRLALKAAQETGSASKGADLSAEEILALDAKREELKSVSDSLKGAIRRYGPFGDFDPALAEKLAAAGAKLAVLSNKPHEVTEPMVRHIFPSVPFDVVMGYTPVFPRKPDPASMHHIAEKWGVSPAEITLVGDSLFDARCAGNAGTGLVLVGWGYAADPAALRAWPAPVCETMEALGQELLGN